MGEAVKQEVTLALIGLKLDTLTEKFDAQAESDKEYKETTEIRMRSLEDKMLTLENDLTISRRVNRLISVFIGGVSAYLGIRF